MGTLAEGDGSPPTLVSAVPYSRPGAQCETLRRQNRGGVGQGQHVMERLKKRKLWLVKDDERKLTWRQE